MRLEDRDGWGAVQLQEGQVSTRTVTAVSAVLVLDADSTDPEENSEHVDVAVYAVDGHVVIALADLEPDADAAELDPLLILTPKCAEVLGRALLGAAALARGEKPKEVGDA